MTKSGLLVVDKPVGPTSHDVVSRVRRLMNTKKVGHAGTLDPDASGLLLVCVGRATRMLEYMTSDVKSYEGNVVFGVATDTDDAVGQVVAQSDATHLTIRDISTVARRFVGEIEQQVPRFSAVHIDGERAYALARRGQSFTPPTRTVRIHALQLFSFEYEHRIIRASFSVTCSKGTYIRSLCRDLGQALGVPAHMSSLRRTASGNVNISSAVPLEILQGSSHPELYVQNPLVAFEDWPRVELTDSEFIRLSQGQRIAWTATTHPLKSRLLAVYHDEIAAVVDLEKTDGLWMTPRKVFLTKEG